MAIALWIGALLLLLPFWLWLGARFLEEGAEATGYLTHKQQNTEWAKHPSRMLVRLGEDTVRRARYLASPDMTSAARRLRAAYLVLSGMIFILLFFGQPTRRVVGEAPKVVPIGLTLGAIAFAVFWFIQIRRTGPEPGYLLGLAGSVAAAAVGIAVVLS